MNLLDTFSLLVLVVPRPPESGVAPPGKAVLSMGGLSHSVIRVDTEEKLSVLTVQDVGQVMPAGERWMSQCIMLTMETKCSIIKMWTYVFIYDPPVSVTAGASGHVVRRMLLQGVDRLQSPPDRGGGGEGGSSV